MRPAFCYDSIRFLKINVQPLNLHTVHVNHVQWRNICDEDLVLLEIVASSRWTGKDIQIKTVYLFIYCLNQTIKIHIKNIIERKTTQ